MPGSITPRPPDGVVRRRMLFARLHRSWLSLLVVGAVLAAIMAPLAHAEPKESRVLPQLQRLAADAVNTGQPERTFRVIVTRFGDDNGGKKEVDRNKDKDKDKDDRNKDRKADKKVKERHGRKLSELPHDAFVAELPASAIAELGTNEGVKFVAPDAEMIHAGIVDNSALVTLNPTTVNASDLWTTRTGAGVGVAVIDSGITSPNDFNKPQVLDQAGKLQTPSRVVMHVQPITGSSVVTFDPSKYPLGTPVPSNYADTYGHGTHVAGIIGGNSWFSPNVLQRGKYIGIAPEANLINIKVADSIGRSYLSDVVTALDWVIANRQTYNIRVVNMSLVSSVAESYKTSVLDAAVERAWFNGIMVVVAAGNAGPNTLKYPPANDPFVLTVGASDQMGTTARTDDGMAPWSSYGISQDGIMKPDVVAPGRYITAPLAPAQGAMISGFAKLFPDRVWDINYIRMSGTSMSAPVVSGIAALMFQAHPEWTNDQAKWLLMQTSTKVGPATAPLVGQGVGQVSAQASVQYTGTPLRANQGLAINQQLLGPNGATTYSNTTAASSWSVSSWSTSSWSTSSWTTSSWSVSNDSSSSWCTANYEQ